MEASIRCSDEFSDSITHIIFQRSFGFSSLSVVSIRAVIVVASHSFRVNTKQCGETGPKGGIFIEMKGRCPIIRFVLFVAR